MDMNVGIRIKIARDQLTKKIGYKVTQEKLAELCGWKDGQSRVSNYENGIRTPSQEDIITIAEVTGSDPVWLSFGRSAPSLQAELNSINETNEVYESNNPLNDFILIPQFQLEENNYQIRKKDYLAFKKTWIKDKELKIEDLIIITQQDDSMSPYINKNDIVMINKAFKKIYDSKIYALSYNNEIKIRKLNTNFDKSITISPVNDLYLNEQVPSNNTNKLRVLGQVIWSGGDI